MVERGELITVCRQIGSMMEAGVDILRITRVLRAQTENPRLQEAYNLLDHDLTMGLSLADSMARAPDVWSPFAVSLVQQGEAHNEIALAFEKIADFLQKEQTAWHEQTAYEQAANERAEAAEESNAQDNLVAATRQPVTSSPLTVIALDGLLDRLQILGLRSLTLLAGLLLALATVWWLVEIGLIERRWLYVLLYSVAALFMGGAGILVQKRIESFRRREARCSFCGVYSPSGVGLERAPRFAGAAICPRCAAIIARRYGEMGQNEVVASFQNNERERAADLTRGADISSNGSSQNGTSANETSANGTSANGTSANGTSANGMSSTEGQRAAEQGIPEQGMAESSANGGYAGVNLEGNNGRQTAPRAPRQPNLSGGNSPGSARAGAQKFEEDYE
jgi:hypothetical protein